MQPTHFSSFWLSEPFEINTLKETWSALALSASHPIFASPDWFEAVMKWRPTQTQPLFWVLKQGSQLKAIIPLIKQVKKIRGIKHTTLEWLKVPDTQFCDIIAHTDDKPLAITKFFKDLNTNSIHWDTLELYPFPAEWVGLIQALPTSLRCHITWPSIHYWVNLNSSWDEYYKSRSRRLKKGNNHLANRLEAQGQIKIKHITDTSDFSYNKILNTVTKLSQSSWKGSTQTTFDFEGPKLFIEALTEKALRSGWLSLWVLMLDKEPIAIEYQLQNKGNIYALRSDFDETFRDLSPGSYLNWKVLEQLFNQDLKSYYMGPGSNAYKTRWQNECDKLIRVKCYANTLKGKLLYSMNEEIIPRLKTISNHFSKKGNIA